MKVEMIPNPSKKEDGKKTRLTHIKGNNGWEAFTPSSRPIDRVVYLGNCCYDGDMFAIYYNNIISFCKGDLNNGIFYTN